MSDEDNDKKPGPDPETLNAKGVDWKDALKHAMRKKKPAEGWPEKPKKKRKRKKKDEPGEDEPK
jgi:hypothetical protein